MVLARVRSSSRSSSRSCRNRSRSRSIILRTWSESIIRSCRPGARSSEPLSQSADNADALKSGVVKSRQSCNAGGSRLVIHKRTITLGDQEHALNVVFCILREVIFEINDTGSGRKISNPQRVARLLGLSGWSSWGTRSGREWLRRGSIVFR